MTKRATRFTSSKPDSHWSKKNLSIVKELIDENGMAGGYYNRKESNMANASYERDTAVLKKEYREKIKANDLLAIF